MTKSKRKPCGICYEVYAKPDLKTCPLCDRVLDPPPKSKLVWICLTVDKHYKTHIMKIVGSQEEARQWRRERVDRIIEMEKLQANYYLRIDKKRVSQKYYKKWSDFAEKHNLFKYEERHSPYSYAMYMDVERGIDKND